MKVRTAMEAMVRRELARERWVGVEHFVPGQLEVRLVPVAEVDPGEPVRVAQVSWVDAMGHAVLVMVVEVEAEGAIAAATRGMTWLPVMACRGGQVGVREIPPPLLPADALEQLGAL